MSIYNVKQSNSQLQPGDNILLWFGKQQINGCEHALVLYGGDLLLLKTEEKFDKQFLEQLTESYDEWVKVFGPGSSSSELREAIRQSHRVNYSKNRLDPNLTSHQD